MTLPFQTPGYEHLELSTQLVIAEALKRGVQVEVLDAKNQFIRLKKGDHVEYVESATKTSKDSYVMSEILGNKVVGKKLLKENGFLVPEGKDYDDPDSAIQDHSFFSDKPIVIKPKTTNYGLGISIFSDREFSVSEFKEAVELAFQHDDSILIEEFIEGIECRFLVIDGKCPAVLNRIPANAVGDGKHNIRELVEIKNSDPRRGKGYKTPLEKIESGKAEMSVLREQGMTFESTPKKDQRIFLRHNSNISTGGDSLDFTDIVHPDYKKIAVDVTQSIGAKICGVDIILKDPTSAFTEKSYGIIELNYNPVLYFHDFPYEGENRYVEKYVLDLLGF